MSYRLIDANALAICKEVNDMSCIYADLPNGLDGGYYDMTQSNTGKSRWHELFGTPERAARVVVALNNCRVVGCEECAARGACRNDGCGDDYDALLEWLKGGSDD